MAVNTYKYRYSGPSIIQTRWVLDESDNGRRTTIASHDSGLLRWECYKITIKGFTVLQNFQANLISTKSYLNVTLTSTTHTTRSGFFLSMLVMCTVHNHISNTFLGVTIVCYPKLHLFTYNKWI